MVDITISNKQMKPAVVHTNQFEDGVHSLRFTIEDYMQGTIDLRNFKAYAVTSLKGHMDITEIPYTVSGRTVTLTWDVTSWTLKDDGVIQYQIRFSESAEDGTAVWYSYKGILVNRLSIPVDDYVSANYPTLLKQWLDRMSQLSGVIEGGESIFYMPVGQPIDVLSRVAGQLYYQIENATTNEGHFEDHLGNRIGEFNAKYISNPDINTLREHGEYVVAGTMTNAPHACTFAFVHVTDSGSTNQQLQTFYAVDSYKVHTYVRTVYNDGKGFGEWSKFATEAQLNADVTALNNEVALKQNKNIGTANAVLVTDVSGNIVASSTITVTELGALNGYIAGAGTVESRMGDLERGLTGEIKWYAGTSVPTGYLLCNGSAVSRTTYSRLFAAIGTTWGVGNSSTTFNLPNLIGRVAWGAATAGTYLEAGLPNITGTIDEAYTGYGLFNGYGAFESTNGSNFGTRGGGGGDIVNKDITFNASKSNNIYGKSNTVQPPAATLMPIIRY